MFHASDFEKYSNTIYISNILVICPEYVNNFDIIYRDEHVELDVKAKTMIAQIKLRQREEIRKEILEEFESEEPDHNDTIYENRIDLNNLKKENDLLKKFIAELEEKNVLLRELLNKEKTSSNISKRSYVDAIKNSKPEPKRIPKLTIKKVSKHEKTSTKNFVQYYLNKEKNVKTKRIIYKSDDDIIIDCMDEESLAVAENLLKQKAQNTFTVCKEQLMNPKVKIVGIENYNNAKQEEIELDINKRNLKNKDKCKILHMYTNKQKKKNTNCNSGSNSRTIQNY